MVSISASFVDTICISCLSMVFAAARLSVSDTYGANTQVSAWSLPSLGPFGCAFLLFVRSLSVSGGDGEAVTKSGSGGDGETLDEASLDPMKPNHLLTLKRRFLHVLETTHKRVCGWIHLHPCEFVWSTGTEHCLERFNCN